MQLTKILSACAEALKIGESNFEIEVVGKIGWTLSV